MKGITHMLLLLAVAITPKFILAADTGGGSGGDESESKGIQDIARENAELAERCAEAGIEVPSFPAGPAGLERAREFMRTALKEKDEEDLKPADPAALEGDALRELAEEEDADFNETDTDEEIRAAIVENRAAKKAAEEQSADPNAGESGSSQSGDPNA